MNLLQTNHVLLLTRLITLVIAFTVHEFAHALVADHLGDGTPRAAGRVTLNPLKHLDVVGSLMLLMAGFGWAKPVPINPAALQARNKNGVMLVSFAGPFSNFLLACLGSALYHLVNLLSWGKTAPAFSFFIHSFLAQFVFINITLLFFNLLPLSPLDGEKVFSRWIPASAMKVWEAVQGYGMVILLSIFMVLPYVGFNQPANWFWKIATSFTRLLLGVSL